MITTIVLIKADPKRIPEAAMKLAGIDGVQEVYSVSGEWDLVAIVKVAEYEQIAQVVTERFPAVSAIERTQTLTAFKKQGVFVLGLDGGGDTPLPGISFADRPIVIVVGSEGKGLSRLVTETCDAIVSIPISADTESLNAGIAVQVAFGQALFSAHRWGYQLDPFFAAAPWLASRVLLLAATLALSALILRRSRR